MNFALTRKLIIFGLVLPLAGVIGFTLATPQQNTTFLFIGAVSGLLLFPIMLKWYHPLLIFSWNAMMNVYFLPGKPELWMLFTAIGFGIVVLNSTLDRERTFIHVPAVTVPLLFLLVVVLVTAQLTGGIGVRALGRGDIGGGAIGGKGYFMIIFAVLGYFVLTSRTIPLKLVQRYLSISLLAGATALFSNIAYMLGPAFYFLFYLFPVGIAIDQAMGEMSGTGIVRISGAASFGTAIYLLMMCRYGVRGIFDVSRPWRMVLFLATIAFSLVGGYRTLLVTYFVHFVAQFYFERLVRTKLCVMLVVGGALGLAAIFPFMAKMPLSVQRCFAFIPGAEISHVARANAESSTRWRTEMWSVVVGDIPKYLILGKGYGINPADLYLAHQAMLRGLAKDYESTIVSGAYHSGPLTVIIPFGIFGSVAFLWFLGVGIWVVYRNYRYGDPELKLVNTFLLAFFLTRVLIFFFVFGGLNVDLFKFTGILGLSIAINRGVKSSVEEPVEEPAGLNLQPVSA